MAHPVKFPGCNLVMRGNMDTVGDLDVFKNRGVIVSAWAPTREELEEITRTGRVMLAILGERMPPALVASESVMRSFAADFGDIWPTREETTMTETTLEKLRMLGSYRQGFDVRVTIDLQIGGIRVQVIIEGKEPYNYAITWSRFDEASIETLQQIINSAVFAAKVTDPVRGPNLEADAAGLRADQGTPAGEPLGKYDLEPSTVVSGMACPKCTVNKFVRRAVNKDEYKCGVCGHRWPGETPNEDPEATAFLQCPKCGTSSRVRPVNQVSYQCGVCRHEWQHGGALEPGPTLAHKLSPEAVERLTRWVADVTHGRVGRLQLSIEPDSTMTTIELRQDLVTAADEMVDAVARVLEWFDIGDDPNISAPMNRSVAKQMLTTAQERLTKALRS